MHMGRGIKVRILPEQNQGLAENFACDYYAFRCGRDKVPTLRRHEMQQSPTPKQLTHYAPELLPLAPLNDRNLQD
jgi:hypothetical protein